MESVEVERTSESRQTRCRSHRRPDKAIYIPRAMRERAPLPTQALPATPAPTQPTPPSTALPSQLATPTQPTPPPTALPSQLATPTQPTPPPTALPSQVATPTQPTPPPTALPSQLATPTQPTPPPTALPSQVATPTQPTPPPTALSSQLATPTTVSPTQLGPSHPSLGVSEESCPAPLANHQPASDALLGDPADSAIPAHSDLGPWEQTMSYFVAMTLDDESDNAGGSFGSAQPEAQLQTEGAKDSGDYLQEISGQLTEADFTIENVHSDYSGYETLWISPGEFAHVIEIYDFPAAFKTDDLLDAFTQFSEGGLKIKWVDNTHALGVFSSESAALQALCMQHPLVKVRSLYEASKKSKGKALRRAEFLQPVKERPRTDTAVARRMVTRALGLPKPVLRGKRC
ncbi:putative uncharacterized protein DDB_G0290521 [Conger conger]|uniref:putative uncharacterized protein DDB_G0290521 n=1 Tax=Conger conger TaxID=82655 RepID=UPI002A5A1DC6|nr:putative uncharacterized protein DDB_G0290521 [Conger conger]